MNVHLATPEYLDRIKELLQTEKLPTIDLSTNSVRLFLSEEDGIVIAVIGIEIKGSIGLLRSLVVRKQNQSKGLAKHLVSFLERYAQSNGVSEIYLLTTSADVFFSKVNYTVVSRNTVPSELKNTKEFSELCPSTAVVMHKTLLI